MFQNANSQKQEMKTDAARGDSVLSGRVAGKNKQSAGDKELESVLYKNGLYYQMPSTKVVAVGRTRQTHVSQRSSVAAPAQSMTVFINSSSEYINGKQCYLGFTIDSDVAGSWGRGSAANVIRSITCTTASGVTVASVDEVGLYKRYNDYYRNRLPWVQEQQIQGYQSDNSSVATYLKGESVAAAATASTSLQIMLPLRDLIGLFDADVLLPPSLIGGMRIDIAFNGGNVSETAVGVGGAGAAVFTITDGRIITDNYQLSPEASNYLKIASAAAGLPVPFKSQSHTQTTGNGSVNMSSSRAVARAMHVFCVHRLAAQTAGGAANLRPTASAAWAAASQFQYRLGNLSFPAQVCQKASEAYQIAVDSFDNEKGRNCGVSFTNFKTNGDAIMAANLERGWMESVPVSSGRLLALNASGLTAGADAEFHMFLTYLNVAKAYINRVELLE